MCQQSAEHLLEQVGWQKGCSGVGSGQGIRLGSRCVEGGLEVAVIGGGNSDHTMPPDPNTPSCNCSDLCQQKSWRRSVGPWRNMMAQQCR